VELHNRIGPADADILVFNKGGRDFRLERMKHGEAVPREFFYGFFDLERVGLRAAMLSSSGAFPGRRGALADFVERSFGTLTALGVRPLSTRLMARSLGEPKVIISYTDGFSLSLGLSFPRDTSKTALMGGFHGLSDIERRTSSALRGLVRLIIARALRGLDHAFFFGPADRDFAIAHYGLPAERSSVILFGVDSEFWRPLPDVPIEDFVLSVGQDPNRDFDLLAAAPGGHPIRIITRQKVSVPANAANVSVTAGDFFNADSLSDEALRRLYNAAKAVVVPLKDVYQPSGYSVTLQAMSCGRPVILSNIRGLWAPELLKHGENCLLVAPGDAAALGAAIAIIRSDRELAARLGRAARATVLAHFGLDKIGAGTVALARLGLSLAGQNERR